MELLKQKVRKNNKDYEDLILVYEFNKKTYSVRVKPVFGCDYRLLMSHAKEVK